jgi:hypothetical protein
MSLSAAIAAIVILDVALIAFLAWMMSHARHLTPHAPQAERFVKQDPVVAEHRQPEGILQPVD